MAATALVEALTVALGWSKLGVLGWVDVRPSVLPGALLLGALGGRRLFPDSRRWLPFYALGAAVVAVQAAQHLDVFGGVAGLVGFGIAALQEEVVFRLALPLTVAAVLTRLGSRAGPARAVGIVAAAALFSFMPNHLRQAGGLLGLLPFFLLSIFFSLVIRRPDALVPAALAHLAYNLLSVAVLYAGTDVTTRGLATVAVLGLLVVSAMARDRSAAPAPAAGTTTAERSRQLASPAGLPPYLTSPTSA